MSLFRKRQPEGQVDDTDLVLSSLGGDRDAFCKIVGRYQNLLCSIAYSSVGDVKYSEDIAQEAFVEAWRKLDTLRDPKKLKSWLCGILRFKVSHHRRKEVNQPAHNAQDIEETQLDESGNTPLEQQAIEIQEQRLMWRALDQMEQIYREPLVLFYREHSSIEHVAAELDLTEATVKQRLSRGRKLLQKSMVKYVEETLVKSKPGAGFTAAVLLTINSIAPPAKAAAFGFGAVKTGSMFKLATIITFIASFAGVISSFFGVRATLDQSRTQRERQQVFKITAAYFGVAAIFIATMFALKYAALNSSYSEMLYAIIAQVFVITFVVSYVVLEIATYKAMQTLRSQERIFDPQAFTHDTDQKDTKQREYRSNFSLFNVPLFHFQFGRPEIGDKPAFAWFAGGNRANGLIFAWGGVAIAPISIGVISYGVVSIGAVSVGLFSVGVVAIGFISFGTTAIAYKGYAAISALGWESAISGGFSIAKEGAIGSIAFANQINNKQAAELAHLLSFEQYNVGFLGIVTVLILVPAIWHSRTVRRRMKRYK